MNTYKCFFQGKTTDLEATSLWDAKQKAVAFFKPKRSKESLVSVILVAVGDREVVTSTASF